MIAIAGSGDVTLEGLRRQWHPLGPIKLAVTFLSLFTVCALWREEEKYLTKSYISYMYYWPDLLLFPWKVFVSWPLLNSATFWPINPRPKIWERRGHYLYARMYSSCCFKLLKIKHSSYTTVVIISWKYTLFPPLFYSCNNNITTYMIFSRKSACPDMAELNYCPAL